MKEITTKLLVIGGGPGGYVAAIRAGQLGVPTVLVEGESLGGTCLNIGCIPSKALIHAAHAFDAARHQAHGSPLGIRVQEPSIDIAQTVRWKDGIVKRLTGGVGALLRKAGVRVRSARADEFALPADRVLVAVGRKPRTTGFGLESLQLDMAGRYVAVDAQCRTSMRNVWAIGDITGDPMLAHRAMAQGEVVAEVIAGKHRRFEPMAIPAVCFTDPEVVVVGKTPGEARAAGLDCIAAAFPFAANGRAMTLEATGGFVRVVARKDNHLILGWQAVGQGVAELAAAFTQSIEMGARLEDVAGTIHAHPTLGEAVQEAALRALGHALHI